MAKRAEQLFVESMLRYAGKHKVEYEELATALHEMKLVPYMLSLRMRDKATKLSVGIPMCAIQKPTRIKLYEAAVLMDKDDLPRGIYILSSDRIKLMNLFSIFIRRYRETYNMTIGNIMDSLPIDIRISKGTVTNIANGTVCTSETAIKLEKIMEYLKSK